jgi:prepilin-type N-terminal cleavage/methylation domain-containing protein
MDTRPSDRHSLQGFTLIELLVVIAIITLLSAVVLSSLNASRGKAADAAIKADFKTVVAQAALDYSSNGGSYGTTAWVANASSFPTGTGVPGSATALFNDKTVGAAMNSIAQQGGAVSYGANNVSFVIVSRLKGGGYWCVDSQGAHKPETSYNAPTPVTSNYLVGGIYQCL